jgi:hypothetical protein
MEVLMLALKSPATVYDVAEALGTTNHIVWAVARWQLGQGASYAIRDEQWRAVAVGGFWPDQKFREAWLILAPAARPRMLGVIRLARLTLADLPQDDPRPVIALARTPEGARIARLLGMSNTGTAVWFWEAAHERTGQQPPRQAGRQRAAGAA